MSKWRNDAEVVERTLPPLGERVALAVAFELLELRVLVRRVGGTEAIDLHRVIDDDLHRLQRVYLFRIVAHRDHRVAHGGQVDDARNAGKILQQHAGRTEGDLLIDRGLRDSQPASASMSPL